MSSDKKKPTMFVSQWKNVAAHARFRLHDFQSCISHHMTGCLVIVLDDVHISGPTGLNQKKWPKGVQNNLASVFRVSKLKYKETKYAKTMKGSL